jgi:hypothetical protein
MDGVVHQLPDGRWILAAWTRWSSEWFALPVAELPEHAVKAPTLEALAAAAGGVLVFDSREDAERAAKALEQVPPR